MKTTVLVIFMGLLTLASTKLKAKNDERKPNIVFILADDLGWAQLGCYGSTYYQTPNIDKLAKEGVLFTNAYAAAAICSPTRASIMTGKYPARLRITDFIPGSNPTNKRLLTPQNWQKYLPLEETTFAEVLKQKGYQTALFGKWHLSKEKTPPGSLKHNPEKQGFDESFVSYKPAGHMKQSWQGAEDDAHNIDTITNRGIEFIRENKDKPFFLMISHNAIHDPLLARSVLINKYKNKPATKKEENHPVIAAMIESLDSSVGRLLQQLDNLDLQEETIVVFFSDNGGKHAYAQQTPLRMGKGWLYEGGIREPLIIRWPGLVKPASKSTAVVSSIDLFPTFLEMAGLDLPENRSIDGVGILPVLQGKELKREKIFWHYPHYHKGSGMKPASAIRWGKYKLIEWHTETIWNESGQVELYDLDKDTGEQNNIVDKEPEVAKQLREALHRWYEELDVQLPVKNTTIKVPENPLHE